MYDQGQVMASVRIQGRDVISGLMPDRGERIRNQVDNRHLSLGKGNVIVAHRITPVIYARDGWAGREY